MWSMVIRHSCETTSALMASKVNWCKAVQTGKSILHSFFVSGFRTEVYSASFGRKVEMYWTSPRKWHTSFTEHSRGQSRIFWTLDGSASIPSTVTSKGHITEKLYFQPWHSIYIYYGNCSKWHAYTNMLTVSSPSISIWALDFGDRLHGTQPHPTEILVVVFQSTLCMSIPARSDWIVPRFRFVKVSRVLSFQ